MLLLFLFSLFVAATIRPFVDWLTSQGLSRTTAQLLLYVVVIGGFFLVMMLVGDLLLLELNIVANRAVIEYEALHRRWQQGATWQQTVAGALPQPFAFAAARDAELGKMLPVVLQVTRGAMGATGSLLLLLALSVYWSVDQYRFERLWLSLLPATRRAYARNSWREIEAAVSSYLRSQAAQSLLAALLLGVGAVVMGLEFPLLLAFFGALAAFVPLLGGLATALVAFGLGSLESYWIGAGTAAYTLVVFLGLELLVEPKLCPPEQRSFLLTMLVIMPLLEAFGLWGLIAAPPLASAIAVLIRQAYRAYVLRRDTAVRMDDLEIRYRQLAQNVAQAEDGMITLELQNITRRLADLLVKSRNMKTA
jgi:predicted PurR-regulated permease PerM